MAKVDVALTCCASKDVAPGSNHRNTRKWDSRDSDDLFESINLLFTERAFSLSSCISRWRHLAMVRPPPLVSTIM